MNFLRQLSFMLLLLIGLAACGGGGGGSGSNSPVYTKAVVKIAITGILPQGTTISGAGCTVTVPAGVTVATGNDGAVATGMVTPSGIFATGTQTPPVYTSSGNTASLKLALASGSPLGETAVGEIVTVVFDLATGIEPTVSSFVLSDIAVVDAGTYSNISGLNISVLSVALQ